MMRVARSFSLLAMVALMCICVFSASACANEETDSATLSEKQAVQKAKQYLEYTSFSRAGLIKQLEYDGFAHEEAVYGVNQCGADWYEQAVQKAKQYLEYTSFSRAGLIKQLEYDGFAHEEAVYGVQAAGY